MKKKYYLFYPVLLLNVFLSFSQEVFEFKSGLVLPSCHRYGREAIFFDQLAYLLNQGALNTPIAGNIVFTNAKKEAIKWTPIKVNESGKFVGNSLSAGYLYLTYQAEVEKTMLLHITNNSMVYVNGEPRSGDLYGAGYLYLPVRLKRGLNEFFVRGGRFSVWGGITARLVSEKKSVFINIEDPTLPIIIANNDNSSVKGAVVLVNMTDKPLKRLQMKSKVVGYETISDLPEIPAMSVRKVAFTMNATGARMKGTHTCWLELMQDKIVVDKKEIGLEMVESGDDYSETFESSIDGSLQYYSISPQKPQGVNPPALFLSVHGAGVEAINQARAYKSKDDGVVICPTNRRPRGFNWEDWGRIDAMEVLNIAKTKFHPDPSRIYLTGHSMGGHGTWFLGATYAGSWAAIAPCAGYPSLSTYGSADGLVPVAGKSKTEDMLLQAGNPGNVYELIHNYNAGGIYIFHGDSDKTVSIDYARDMHLRLSSFTKDISYYEYPGGSHWFGDESVDWKPIFDYFKWHTIPADTAVKSIDFTTANPAVSSKHYWTAILQQKLPLKYSNLKLQQSDDRKTITGKTKNIALLSLTLDGLKYGSVVKITLDDQPAITYTIRQPKDIVYLHNGDKGWAIMPNTGNSLEKGVVRNGTFKEPFNHRMVFVYGSSGTKEENDWAFNKARYDAECWYYRGNGAVEIVADKLFTPKAYPDRGVVLYGNSITNSAWASLLSFCPIQVSRDKVVVEGKIYTGSNLAAYFMWPRADSKTAGIAVVSGTGIEGMKAADANQYFSAGSGFPDYMIFTSGLLIEGASGIKQAGFYGNDWTVRNGQTAD